MTLKKKIGLALGITLGFVASGRLVCDRPFEHGRRASLHFERGNQGGSSCDRRAR